MFLCRISFNYGNYDLFSTRVCNIWDETFHLLHLEVDYVWDITWCTLIFQVDTTSTGNSGADVRLLVPSMSLDLRWSPMSVPPPSIYQSHLHISVPLHMCVPLHVSVPPPYVCPPSICRGGGLYVKQGRLVCQIGDRQYVREGADSM